MNLRGLAALLCLLLVVPAYAGDLRDPMRPVGAPTAARPAPVYSLKLEGVISGGQRVAIINGRLVKAGDQVAGARIVEVFATGVCYERAGKIQTLTLSVATANANVRVARSDKKAEAK
jgi:MSHA biogenesis protein MshK